MVRAALGMMLGGSSGISVVAEAQDGEEALRVVPASGADVVLMDIRMPVRDGLSATEELLRTHPDLKIIVLTTFDTDDMVLRALRTGRPASCSRTPSRPAWWRRSGPSRPVSRCSRRA